MFKKVITYCVKLCFASLIAFLALNAVCMLYYNLPIHVASTTKSTDYKWMPQRFYSKGTEGFSSGKTDKNGFINSYKSSSEKVDILVMGSSHMEAINVPQNKNTTYRLNELLSENNMDMYAYNIGMSGHPFLANADNLKNAVAEFKPTKYIIMEIDPYKYTQRTVDAVLSGTRVRQDQQASGLMYTLQKVPFLRCLKYQLTFAGILGESGEDADSTEKRADQTKTPEFKKSFTRLISSCSETAKENNVKIIAFCNSNTRINKDGTMADEDFEDYFNMIDKICTENNIVFINMYDSFKNGYERTHKLAHGFSNSPVGLGHLNSYGHELIAESLYETISKLEATGGAK